MGFVECGGLRYYRFDLLDHPGLTHAVFTRRGGTSPKPWASLNMGNLVGDERGRVETNRKRAFELVGRNPDTLYDVWQVHSAQVVQVGAPRPMNASHLQADGMLTSNPGVTLFMRFADCVPILLFDPVVRVAGLVHAGWRGTVQKIAAKAIQIMVTRYGSQVKNIIAAIGPSISPQAYEVGQDVVDQVRQVFKGEAEGLLAGGDGRVTFDLWEANRTQLAKAGLEQIEVAGLCTASNLDDWYSYRAEEPPTGRFGVLIGLNP